MPGRVSTAARTTSTSASIIIPTFNGASRIGNCLDSLVKQTAARDVEILVVDDGSTDNTAEVVRGYSSVRLITQANAGPAAARNRGAQEARGTILLFTDDDCVPMPDWVEAMLRPFSDPEVVGAKGVYRTRQKSLAARFVQIEYEDKYRLMTGLPSIDFIDTYSAGFRRERFLEMAGYDTSFPVACAEDIELSYRMSARGWKMKFVPAAIVYHTHPDTFSRYLKKKYKFAFWRVLAVLKNPSKGVKDSHTPQTMKLQLLFAPALLVGVVFDLAVRPRVPASAIVLAGFLLSTLPFALRAIKKDPVVGLLSPVLLAARACAQVLGVGAGLMYARRKPFGQKGDSKSNLIAEAEAVPHAVSGRDRG
jgi:GT2 family glycosyltransferase